MRRDVPPQLADGRDIELLEAAAEFSRMHRDQSSVIVDAVDSCGVTPEPVTMFGVTVPDHRIAAAPPPVDLPVDQKVAVPAPPVPAGNAIAATGDHLRRRGARHGPAAGGARHRHARVEV
jgi:hypothetical protein